MARIFAVYSDEVFSNAFIKRLTIRVANYFATRPYNIYKVPTLRSFFLQYVKYYAVTSARRVTCQELNSIATSKHQMDEFTGKR